MLMVQNQLGELWWSVQPFIPPEAITILLLVGDAAVGPVRGLSSPRHQYEPRSEIVFQDQGDDEAAGLSVPCIGFSAGVLPGFGQGGWI